jgi:hypothetical protein
VEHTGDALESVSEGRRISVRAGNYQSAQTGRPFSAQLGAAVTDAEGHAVVGAYVTFRIVSGAATFGRGSLVATVRTGANGLAVSAVVLAGERTGSVKVTANTTLAPRPATYSLRVIPGPSRPRPALR